MEIKLLNMFHLKPLLVPFNVLFANLFNFILVNPFS